MTAGLVSIIIPTFNRADLLVEAVTSIMQQSYTNFEIIIVDDDSPDDTDAKIAAIPCNKITYIKQKRRGAGYARNHGLEHAKGKYVAFLDDDDFWLEFKLQLQVQVMEYFPDIAFLCSDFYILKEQGRLIPKGLATWFRTPLTLEEIYAKKAKNSDIGIHHHTYPPEFSIYLGNIYTALLHSPYVLPSTSIVRRSTLEPSIRFAEDLRVYEDWVFFAKLARNYDSAFVDAECTVNRGHSNPQRLTSSDALTKFRCRLKLIDYVWNENDSFRASNSGEIDQVCHSQYIAALKYCLLEGGNSSARKVLTELKNRPDYSLQGWLLLWTLLVYIPFSSQLLRGLRLLKRKLLPRT